VAQQNSPFSGELVFWNLWANCIRLYENFDSSDFICRTEKLRQTLKIKASSFQSDSFASERVLKRRGHSLRRSLLT
jgi:hypothetical protein